MALVVKDRVKVYSSTTGTGTLSLGSAFAGFQTFNNALGDGDTTYYGIFESSTGNWEVGLGTYTSSGNTLSRDTILESSNAGAAVNLTADTEVFITYPADKSVYFDANGDVNLNRDPQSALQAATKQYVDTIAAAGIHYHDPVRVESPDTAGNLTATYDNGSSGVGATLTNSGTQAALVIDGVTVSTNDRVLIYNQTNGYENGIYTVTNTGSASTNWVLTRATDADSYGPSDPDSFGQGDAFFVKEGDTGAGELYVMNTAGEIVFGTTDINFIVVAETAVYIAGDGLTLSGTEFNVGAGTGITVNATSVSTVQDIATSATPTFDGLNTTGNITFGDNDKAIFGAGSDLQIYHDGTGSKIYDSGTGNLQILGDSDVYIANAGNSEYKARFITNGAVELYYDSVKKLATTSTGVDITGTLTSDALTVDGAVRIQGVSTGLIINETDTTDLNSYLTTSGGVFKIFTVNDAFSSFTERLRVNHSTGDISFYEDTGTTAKFFWDASAERLGIGNTAPSTILHLTDTHPSILFETSGGGATDQAYIQKYSNDLYIYNKESAGKLFLGTNNGTKATIDSSGNVGIGTTSPIYAADIKTSGTNNGQLRVGGGSTSATGLLFEQTNSGTTTANIQNSYYSTSASASLSIKSGYTTFHTGTSGSERMRIDNNGNVGIGTSSPSSFMSYANNLVVGSGSGGEGITVYSASNQYGALVFADGTTGDSQLRPGQVVYDHSANSMFFSTNASEAMRIDSSGNLLVGKTSASTNTVGVEARPDGTFAAVKSNGGVAVFGRNTSDGDIALFRKDGTTVGSIGVAGGNNLQIASTATDHAGLAFGTHVVAPLEANADSDGTIDLGSGAARFKDLYLSGDIELGGALDVQATLGTWIRSDQMTDSIGWNTSHGVYIGSDTSGSSTYIYGSGKYYDGSTVQTLWHTGNDGSGSGLDADTVDGIQASSFLRSDDTDAFSGTITSSATGIGMMFYGAAAWRVSSSDSAHQRADARDDGVESRLHWYGVNTSGTSQEFRHAWYDGSNYINVTALSSNINFERVAGTANLQVHGNTVWHAGNDGSGSGLDADLLDGLHESTFMRRSANSTLDMNNNNITEVNHLQFNDPGPNEGIEWLGGSGWKIYESPDNLTTNTGGNLQFVQGTTREMTLNTSGSLYTAAQGTLWGSSNDGSGSGLDADLLDGNHAADFQYRKEVGFYVAGDADKFYKVKIPVSQDGDHLKVYRRYNWGIGGSSSYWNGGSTTHFGALMLDVKVLTNQWGGQREYISGNLAHNYTVVAARAHMGVGSEFPNVIVYLRGGAGGSGAYYQYEVESGSTSAPTIDYNTYLTSADTEYNYIYANNVINDAVGRIYRNSSIVYDAGSEPQLGYIDVAGGNYGTIKVDDDLGNDWAGYSIRNNFVFMGRTDDCGIYNDVDNEWFIYSQRNAGTALYYNGTSTFATVSGGAAATGTLTATGDITAYFSDERLKDFDGKIEGALDKVSQLNGYYYRENDKAKELGFENDDRQVGVSAQEVEAVLPEVIKPAPVDPEYKTVQYEKLVPLLIEAIKELKEEVRQLKEDKA